MKTEDFWNKYLNEDALELFETACDFFSKELPKEFIEDYDVGEVILETRGGLEVVKEFEKVIKLSILIKNKQPELYKEYFQYFDDFLIDYYCFTNDPKEVEEAFSNFILNPIQDIDQYLILLKKLLFYGYSDIINEAIIKNFNEISTSDELIGYAEYDLSMIKFYTTLEDFYKKSNKISFEKEIFIKTLQGYGFDFDNDFLFAIKKGIQERISKELILSSFYNDRKNFIVTLEIYFLRYMQERKFPFALSGKLWGKLLAFWSDNTSQNKCSAETYFKANIDDFEKYILSLNSDMFIDNKSEMIAVLWGSVYVYDFLNSIEIIDKTSFNNFKEISKILKGKVINNYISELWDSNFIHLWEKPDSITTVEFVEEEKIFKKSLSLKHQKFTILRSEISKELNNIGELSKYIIKGGGNIKRHNMFDFFNDKQNLRVEEDRITKPIIAEKKVGRNEPCPCGSGKKFKKCCIK